MTTPIVFFVVVIGLMVLVSLVRGSSGGKRRGGPDGSYTDTGPYSGGEGSGHHGHGGHPDQSAEGNAFLD